MPTFPFSAIVGQDALKEAVLLSAVDPGLGGVLAFGDRGTGKTSLMRSVAQLLPPIQTVKGCAYNCTPRDAMDRRESGENDTGTFWCDICCRQDNESAIEIVDRPVPVIDLPLGATEDRVLGALDLEAALVRGEKRFEPGLLARAHRGFLYIDEVNLLEDHLIDVLLDVAASGENLVEREGMSIRHPARFVLVGSGNPEEGELRPQLLDRFGLSVEVRTPTEIDERIEIVRRRDRFDQDPDGFMASWQTPEGEIRNAILAGQAKLRNVTIPDDIMTQIAQLCITLGADGLRGELTLMRAARAAAALDGRDRVSLTDIGRIAPSALRHRLRKQPLDETDATTRIARALTELGIA